ncbi:MAG: A/G-specific adenine glycosylase [Mariprofundales bacterium]
MTALSSVACNPTATQALLQWYQQEQRDLPWRQTRDPYQVWISEIMLQQTQVVTVRKRYADWLQQFPTLPSVAAAGEDRILKAWQGLGYYRRARLLHQAACLVVAQHNGQFPHHFNDIVALPGIGPSTAGAIASSCFNTPRAVLDANVKRVLRRWHQLPQATDRQLWLLANQALYRADAPAQWNQAMMELGACCCQARQAACSRCPLEPHCQSAHQPIAVTSKPRTIQNLHWHIHIHHHPQHGLWLTQRPNSGIWGRLWTPPIEPFIPTTKTDPDLIHPLTHRRLHLYAHKTAAAPTGSGKWVTQPSDEALPTGIERLLQQVTPELMHASPAESPQSRAQSIT